MKNVIHVNIEKQILEGIKTMTRRYLVTVAALVDADPDTVQSQINQFTSRVVGITHLPLSTKIKLLPTKEELDKMDKREVEKWQRRIQRNF